MNINSALTHKYVSNCLVMYGFCLSPRANSFFQFFFCFQLASSFSCSLVHSSLAYFGFVVLFSLVFAPVSSFSALVSSFILSGFSSCLSPSFGSVCIGVSSSESDSISSVICSSFLGFFLFWFCFRFVSFAFCFSAVSAFVPRFVCTWLWLVGSFVVAAHCLLPILRLLLFLLELSLLLALAFPADLFVVVFLAFL